MGEPGLEETVRSLRCWELQKALDLLVYLFVNAKSVRRTRKTAR